MEEHFNLSNDRFFFHPLMNDEEITDILDKFILQNQIKDNEIVYLAKLPGRQLSSYIFDFNAILSLCNLYHTPMEILLNALVVLIDQYGSFEENMFIITQHLKEMLLSPSMEEE